MNQFLVTTLNDDALILKDPSPIVAVRSYPQYSIEIMLRFWTKKQDAAVMFNRLQEKIERYAQDKNIWIALQQEV